MLSLWSHIKTSPLFPPTSPNYQDYVLLHIADKAICASKRGPLGDPEVHSETTSVCKLFLFMYGGRIQGLPPRNPTAAHVVNPTTPFCHHIHEEMRVDGLCPTIPGWQRQTFTVVLWLTPFV